MAKAGHRTVVVERKLIGGSCPNIACLPSKNIIHSAKVAQLVHRAGEFGIKMGNVIAEMAKVNARKRKMSTGEIRLHLELYKASGAELVVGEAHFASCPDKPRRPVSGCLGLVGHAQSPLPLPMRIRREQKGHCRSQSR